jgi:hypothetical protein
MTDHYLNGRFTGFLLRMILPAFSLAFVPSVPLLSDEPPQTPEIRIIPDHSWLPPFGLDRIGRSLPVEVNLPARQDANTEYWLAGYVDGKEIQRSNLSKEPKSVTDQKIKVEFDVWPSEVVLLAKSLTDGKEHRVATQTVIVPGLEAEAVAWPVKEVNPVDLGTVFVPNSWLLLSGGQAAAVEVAALNHGKDLTDATVTAWFGSIPQKRASTELRLDRDRRLQVKLVLEGSSINLEHDTLHVAIMDSVARELWRKDIPVILVRQPPQWPHFGATETKLRYDAPVSVKEKDGTFSSLDYNQAWDESLKDVVVSLPNGSRFVFWRGSNYVPFWASGHNTGITYEWAETARKDAVDCVEPLMDKELRYGRVKIIESTAARVHVRWSYQACDFNYKVWGDMVTEDFYFYPDGFGTRVLTLQSDPVGEYELSEFIIITPQGAIPFSVLPSNLVDILFLDGEKREITFPYLTDGQDDKLKPRDLPAVFRVRVHKNDDATAIYFCPADSGLPRKIYAPFYDLGQVVTPCYWGSHWPLSRGQTTCWAISDLVFSTPAANSIMTWDLQRPTPLRDASFPSLDMLGRSTPVRTRTWAWLIGFTDSPNSRLLEWAHSYSSPPSISDLRGARLADEPYVPERRAIGLNAETSRIELTLTPRKVCVNPVLEISGWASNDLELWINKNRLTARDYAWDGKVLWINTTFSEATDLCIDANDKNDK